MLYIFYYNKNKLNKTKKGCESHLLHDQIPFQGIVIWLFVTSVILRVTKLCSKATSLTSEMKQGAVSTENSKVPHLVRFLGDSGGR